MVRAGVGLRAASLAVGMTIMAVLVASYVLDAGVYGMLMVL